MLRRTPFKSKAPERRPERQWEGPAPVIEPPRATMARLPAPVPKSIVSADALPPDRAAEGKTAAGRAHMGRVAALGCVLCRLRGIGTPPAEVHHVRLGQGMAQRASDFLTVPLCPSCHRGPFGIHGDRRLLRAANVSEIDLLAETLALLFEEPASPRAGSSAVTQRRSAPWA